MGVCPQGGVTTWYLQGRNKHRSAFRLVPEDQNDAISHKSVEARAFMAITLFIGYLATSMKYYDIGEYKIIKNSEVTHLSTPPVHLLHL